MPPTETPASDEIEPIDAPAPDRNKPKARRRIRRRILRSTAVLPAAFTLLNGLAGFGAIHFAAKSTFGATLDATAIWNLRIAAGLIFAAMLCDMLDGRLARMTRSTSDFGAQLDSLCDMVSFGTAPALIVLRLTISTLRSQVDFLPIERMVWCVAGIYVACAALRLARFNVETEQDESAHMDFHGLPSPAAAACLSSLVLLFGHVWDQKADAHWSWLPSNELMIGVSAALPVIMLGCALLMVSRYRYPHIVNQYIRGKRSFSYLVKLVFIVLAAFMSPWLTLAAVVLVFVISAPLRTAWQLARRRRRERPVSS
jgi:CDP-diacylglycerol--serine O-phosphatidyltransferase